MDNRHGLIVATDARAPGYDAERDAALEMFRTSEPRERRRTLGAEKGCAAEPRTARATPLNRPFEPF